MSEFRPVKRRKTSIYENQEIEDFFNLKDDEIYFFSYSYDLEEINQILHKNISFYGSGSLIEHSRIFVNDALVSFDYDPTYTLYGIVIKMNKNDFNTLYHYENNQYQIKSKIIEKDIYCELYDNISKNMKGKVMNAHIFMKTGSNEDLKLKRMPTIEEMLKIRNMLNMRHTINQNINSTRLYIKGYQFFEDDNHYDDLQSICTTERRAKIDISIHGIFRGNCEIELFSKI